MTFEPRGDMEHMQVNHKDFDISNNKLSNLEWTTRQENMDHYTSSDKFTNRVVRSTIKGENHHLCVMTDELVIEFRRRYGEIKLTGGSRSKLAREFGIAESTARQSDNRWGHLEALAIVSITRGNTLALLIEGFLLPVGKSLPCVSES